MALTSANCIIIFRVKSEKYTMYDIVCHHCHDTDIPVSPSLINLEHNLRLVCMIVRTMTLW